MDIEESRIADTVNITAPLTLADYRSGLPGKAIQSAALSGGEMAGRQGLLAMQLEQGCAQGSIHTQASSGSMTCQLWRLIWLLPLRV